MRRKSNNLLLRILRSVFHRHGHINRRPEREIDDRKRTAVKLLDSELLYKTLFDATSAAILLLTPEGRFLNANAAAIALFGCKDEKELLLRSPASLSSELQPDGKPSATKAREMMSLATAKGTHRFEWMHKRIDGEEFLATVTLISMELDDGPVFLATLHDITEQRRAEEALRENEQLYRLLVQNVDVGINVISTDFTILSVNEAMCRMFHVKPEDFIGKKCFYEFEKRDSPCEGCAGIEAMATGQMTSTERVGVQDDGSTFHARVGACPLFNEDGKITSFVELVEDITEYKNIQEDLSREIEKTTKYAVELAEKNQLLEREITEREKAEEDVALREFAMNNITDEAFMIDSDSRVVYVNNQTCRALKYTRDELIGMCVADFDPDYPAERWPSYWEELKSRRSLALESHHKTKDGYVFPVEISTNYFEYGGQAYCMAIARDITERKQIEEERVLSTQRMESLLGLSHMADKPMKEIMATIVEESIRLTQSEIGYLATTNEDESILTMQYWSKTAHDMCEVIDRPLDYPIETTGLWGEAVRQRQPIVTNDYAASNPLKRGTPEGHVPIVRHMNIPVFDGQRVVAVAGVGNKGRDYDDRDVRQLQLLLEGWWRIVAQKQYELELAQARDAADAANQAKSSFLASMSHEIRTPMTAILGYSELLMDPNVDASERNNYATVIHRNGKHLLTLINDILDLSKIEAGKLAFDMRQCSIVSLLADVASVVRPRAEQRGISLSVECQSEMPETILTDGNRLRQAVLNLVGNAVKFTEQGSVRIVVAFLPQGLNGQPTVQIEVIDTGIGIRKEVIPNLFQPFSQADSTISQKFGGTGLGLAISRQIAQMLDGNLTVSSVFGQGSTFTLTMPTGDLSGVTILEHPNEVISAGIQRAVVAKSAILEGVRVLLAEDGYDNRRLIETHLRGAGAEVVSVENGRLAVERAQAEPFDVVLMDINMPEMDGFEATRLLRSQGYDRPIVALTANAMAGDREKCHEAGCNEHLAKPIDSARLTHTVARFAGREIDEHARPEPTASATAAEPSDKNVIVSQYANDPVIATILSDFIACLEPRLDAMHRAVTDQRFEELQLYAHRLRGSGGSYGFPSLTNVVKELEDAAKVQDTVAIHSAIDAVDKVVRAILRGHPTTATSVENKS